MKIGIYHLRSSPLDRIHCNAVGMSLPPHPDPLPKYLFSGSGCPAATTPPRAAAERFARTAQSAASLCAAERGATGRSATSSTSLKTYLPKGKGRGEGKETVDYLTNFSQRSRQAFTLVEL